MNRLYYGDNLTIMQKEIAAQSVDLIYLDPPFNSQKNYNLIYTQATGKPVPAQVEAFCDTWELDAEKEELASKMPVILRAHEVEDYYVKFWRYWILALRNTHPKLLAYLLYMVQRLLYMKILLKPTGAIYLHCDPNASHYIKVMMDGIFGHGNFRNEITWRRVTSDQKGSQHDRKSWGNNADIILFYTRSNQYKLHGTRPLTTEEAVQKFNQTDETGRRYYDDSSHIWRTPGMGPRPNLCYEWRGFTNPHPSGWRLKKERLEEEYQKGNIVIRPDGKLERRKYEEDYPGAPIGNIWTDIGPVPARSGERIGYPTQKPVTLLKRIVRASCPPDGLVFDPFCGCGTTTYAAQETGRRWIGCDIAILAIKLIKYNLEKAYGLHEDREFEIDGIPVSVEGAVQLFRKDPFQFQHWAVERVDGFPTQKKVADKGIDGNIYFETDDGYKDMVISVKGGTVRPTDIRDLRGVLERDTDSGTVMAGFISNREPTKAMKDEAAKAGMYTYAGHDYERIQLLTTKQILEDKMEFRTPSKIGVKQKMGQLNLDIIRA